MLFFKKHIASREYLELKEHMDKLQLKFKSLELDLELYTRKLKASKGIKDKEEQEDKINKGVILPERNG